jgi:hypothetical protein
VSKPRSHAQEPPRNAEKFLYNLRVKSQVVRYYLEHAMLDEKGLRKSKLLRKTIEERLRKIDGQELGDFKAAMRQLDRLQREITRLSRKTNLSGRFDWTLLRLAKAIPMILSRLATRNGREQEVPEGPPRFRLKFLLRRLMSAKQFDDTLESLNEIYQRERLRNGSNKADRWYRRQEIGLAGQYLVERSRRAITSALRLVGR